MSCSCCKKTNAAHAALKFSGALPSTVDAPHTPVFLADTGFATEAISTPIAYPPAERTTFSALKTNLSTSLAALTASLTIELLKNGVVVPGFTINYNSAGVVTGLQNVSPTPVTYDPSAGDTLDLRVSFGGDMPAQHLSAFLS